MGAKRLILTWIAGVVIVYLSCFGLDLTNDIQIEIPQLRHEI